MAAAGRRRYRPPSNYARIIKVESHREYWRAVHSNCSLGIYTCGTPRIARGLCPVLTLACCLFSLSLFLIYTHTYIRTLFHSCCLTLDTASLAPTSLLAYLLHRGNNEANYSFSDSPSYRSSSKRPSGFRQAAFSESNSPRKFSFCDHLDSAPSLPDSFES